MSDSPAPDPKPAPVAPAPEALSTPRLHLRRFLPADIATLSALYAKPEVMEFIVPGGRTAEQSAAACARLLAQWEANGFGAWLLHARPAVRGGPMDRPGDPANSDATPQFAGVAMLMRDPAGPVEVGYALDRPYWGRGLATEVVGALVDIAFRVADLPGLFARLDPPNVASARVLVKHGFTLAKETRPEGGRATDWYLLRRTGREASLPPGT